MPHKQPEFHFGIYSIVATAVGAVFGMVGGIAKHLSDIQESKVVFTWIGVFMQAFISAFIGSIVSMYMLENEFSLYMVFIGAGLSGFAGVVLLRAISNKVYRNFGIDPDKESKNDEK